jgi:DNA processing protein
VAPPHPRDSRSDPERLRSWIRLALTPGVGPTTAHRLLAAFGSVEAIFEADEFALAGVQGLDRGAIAGLLDPGIESLARRDLERCAELEIVSIPFDDPAYPVALRDLHHPPILLYAKGSLAPVDRLAISIVGARKPSDYGRQMVARLTPPLAARGLTVVSGLAYGIDAEAHAAALSAGGRTLAVLGQGLATPVHPASNRRLAERILGEGLGALVSVFPIDDRPTAGSYPQRNEIIAALSLGTLVVEAGEKSGALITAGAAAELGRMVMACPGDATRASARGANALIAEGAHLVQTSDDVLEAIAPALRLARAALVESGDWASEPDAEGEAERPAPAPIDPDDPIERRIREALTEEQRPLDYLLAVCASEGRTQGEVIQKLLEMELAGRARQWPGRIYSLP